MHLFLYGFVSLLFFLCLSFLLLLRFYRISNKCRSNLFPISAFFAWISERLSDILHATEMLSRQSYFDRTRL